MEVRQQFSPDSHMPDLGNEDMAEGVDTIPLPNKGSLKQCENSRTKSLISYPSKLSSTDSRPMLRKCWQKNKRVSDLLVSCCFEPSHPQRIISGLKTNFNLSPNYLFHKSLYRKSFVFLSQTTTQITSTILERKFRK